MARNAEDNERELCPVIICNLDFIITRCPLISLPLSLRLRVTATGVHVLLENKPLATAYVASI